MLELVSSKRGAIFRNAVIGQNPIKAGPGVPDAEDPPPAAALGQLEISSLFSGLAYQGV
jgi:hypothetical protein